MGVAAHVIAALSPNNSWARNVYDAGELLHHELLAFAEPSPRFCTYPANVDKARLIVRSYLSGSEWREILRGRKVTNFAHNIEFPQNEDGNVTVNVHAYSIAHGRRYTSATIPSIGKAKYAQVSRAYRAVAKETGFRAHEMEVGTGTMRLLDGDPPIIQNLVDVAFWWGWAEHFDALADRFRDEDPFISNGLRNKAIQIIRAIEAYKRREGL